MFWSNSKLCARCFQFFKVCVALISTKLKERRKKSRLKKCLLFREKSPEKRREREAKKINNL